MRGSRSTRERVVYLPPSSFARPEVLVFLSDRALQHLPPIPVVKLMLVGSEADGITGAVWFAEGVHGPVDRRPLHRCVV